MRGNDIEEGMGDKTLWHCTLRDVYSKNRILSISVVSTVIAFCLINSITQQS